MVVHHVTKTTVQRPNLVRGSSASRAGTVLEASDSLNVRSVAPSIPRSLGRGHPTGKRLQDPPAASAAVRSAGAAPLNSPGARSGRFGLAASMKNTEPKAARPARTVNPAS